MGKEKINEIRLNRVRASGSSLVLRVLQCQSEEQAPCQKPYFFNSDSVQTIRQITSKQNLR